MNLPVDLAKITAHIISLRVDKTILPDEILVNQTPKEYPGDYTIVLFPLLKKTGLPADELAKVIYDGLCSNFSFISGYNVVKGFFNIELDSKYWNSELKSIQQNTQWGFQQQTSNSSAVIIEYPSPNTNKPLHLGHLRNIFLGFSLSRILEANGKKVHPVCLYNDRGTNISKSMWAYLNSKDKKTPESSGIKGDKLVGDYYVQFNDESKKAIQSLIAQGISEEEAKKQNPLDKQIAQLTIDWENGDSEVRKLWEMMNGWFYEGVQKTYDALNLSFDKLYYESDVYNLGRETVKEGLEKGVFFQKEDGSVWIDLTDIGLDQKVVLRSNGTTVYMTQDIALAYQKQKDYEFDQSIYVVGNEQDYHFKVLFEILKRLGMKASDQLYNLSYGMVELPSGKMKSREGTVVDADDLIEEVIQIAKEKANEQGKLSEISDEEKQIIYKQIGLGALRYFILKVDPKKKMIFNPQESIDFNGNTAPFIQYIYARTQSLLRNAAALQMNAVLEQSTIEQYQPNEKESRLIRNISQFPLHVHDAAKHYSPALIANYVYELASDFSNFYHDYKVIKEENQIARNFRLALTFSTGNTIKNALYLLGIDAPERM